jgi:hypothetical protein
MLKGSMPQGTWLGPLIFILLINDLSTSCMLHKYVDDSTLSEFLKKGGHSSMDIYFDMAVEWSKANLMNINYKKTKEMFVGSADTSEISNLLIDGNIINRVTVYKLLGVHIDSNLKWNTHVNYICA